MSILTVSYRPSISASRPPSEAYAAPALAEKERLVALALEPRASASEIARSAGLDASQLFRWRKQLPLSLPLPGRPNRSRNR